MFEEMAEAFDLGKIDLATYSPLTLAYIGDCVYELIIRTRLVYAGNAPVDKLNRKASNLAKAGTQSAMIEALIPELTDEETAAYKRGRNAHSYTGPRTQPPVITGGRQVLRRLSDIFIWINVLNA